LEHNHTFDPSKFKVLHTEDKGKRLNNLEILEINKSTNDHHYLLNAQTNFITSPLLYGFKD